MSTFIGIQLRGSGTQVGVWNINTSLVESLAVAEPSLDDLELGVLKIVNLFE